MSSTLRASRLFVSAFGVEPTWVAAAPGRVNLIGEHTDYHEGFVLPTVIPQRTRVHLRARPDQMVRARSLTLDTDWAAYALGRETRRHDWLDYVQGVTQALASANVSIGGFDVTVESDVPVGAGVSSSAALEVSLARGLRELFALAIDDVGIAKVGQAAETDFVGAPVGIMDQMVASLGHDGEALFIDTRSLRTERVPLPDTIDLVVIDSGVTHAHAGGAYVTRRRQSFEAAALLGVGHLRDVPFGELGRLQYLPPTLARRARHIVTENQRVLDAVDALRAGDGARLGALFIASHASMRDDYEVSTPDIDTLVTIATADGDVFGARMTGGGFGGAVVLAVHAGTAARVARDVRETYVRHTGLPGAVLVPAELAGTRH